MTGDMRGRFCETPGSFVYLPNDPDSSTRQESIRKRPAGTYIQREDSAARIWFIAAKFCLK